MPEQSLARRLYRRFALAACPNFHERAGRQLFADRLATDGVANGVEDVDEVARLADLAQQGDA